VTGDQELKDTGAFLDEGDDLFDFDELIDGAEEVVDQLSNELDEALAEVQVEEQPSPLPLLDAEPAAVIDPAPAFVPAPPVPPLAALAPHAPSESSGRGSRPSLTALALGVMMLANVALVGLTWKSLDTTQDLIAVGGANPAVEHVPEPVSATTAAPAHVSTASLPLEDAPPEAYSTLFEAESSMERGEYRRARRTVFGLLAVIDRVPEEERSDVEAKAGFLVAESYRLEARGPAEGDRL